MNFINGDYIGIIFLLILGGALAIPLIAYYNQPKKYREEQDAEIVTEFGVKKISRGTSIYTILMSLVLILFIFESFAGIESVSGWNVLFAGLILSLVILYTEFSKRDFSDQQKIVSKVGSLILTVFFVLELLFYLYIRFIKF